MCIFSVIQIGMNELQKQSISLPIFSAEFHTADVIVHLQNIRNTLIDIKFLCSH